MLNVPRMVFRASVASCLSALLLVGCGNEHSDSTEGQPTSSESDATLEEGAGVVHDPRFVIESDAIAADLKIVEDSKKKRPAPQPQETIELEPDAMLLTAAAVPDYKLTVKGYEKQTTVFKQRNAEGEATFRIKTPKANYDAAKAIIYKDGKIIKKGYDLALKPGGTFKVTLKTGMGYIVVTAFFKNEKFVSRGQTPQLIVGDIFLTAGQSNSTNAGSGSTASTTGGSFMFTGSDWQVAKDPYYTADTTTGSSPWPYFGDFYYGGTGVPVGTIALGWTGTYIAQWQAGSGTNLFERLANYAKALGPNGFRAVLWLQGESDVFMGTYDTTYKKRLKKLIDGVRKAAKWNEMPWAISRTSYIGVSGWGIMCDYLGGESQCASKITARQNHVINGQNLTIKDMGNVFMGPYTDQFNTATYRADQGNSYIHFNQTGQYYLAQSWYTAVTKGLKPFKK